MTTKAEKLARELIALSERYSPKDFEKAAELLLSGQLFAQATETALKARNAVAAAKQRVSKGKPTRQSRPGLVTRSDNVDREPVQLELDDLLRDVEEQEREALGAFALRFQNREILKTGLSARIFAEQVGIDLPAKLPSRTTLLRVLVRELSHLSKDSRETWLREAERFGNSESSLQ